MRVGVLSDTHISARGDTGKLGRIVRRHFQDVTTVLHAGDLTSLQALERELVDFELIAVAGNMDDPLTVQSLPTKRVLTLGSTRVGLIHGWGPPAGVSRRIADEFEDVDVIVYGHTHRAESVWRNGVLFFNPGSPEMSRAGAEGSIGILETEGRPMGRLIFLEE